jgi:hypothetical protein
MDISLYHSKGVVFPGRAGQLQMAGAKAALVVELGDNYPTYHNFLATELAKLGRPHPKDYPDYDSYITVYAKAQTIVIAEAFLRNCRAYRRDGASLDAPLDTSTPLLDANDRLVGLDSPR